jgi:hypothetical protein
MNKDEIDLTNLKKETKKRQKVSKQCSLLLERGRYGMTAAKGTKQAGKCDAPLD